jgi:thymidylate kinase
MGNAPIKAADSVLNPKTENGPVSAPEQAGLSEGADERRRRLQSLQEQHSYFLERIADSRVLIIEGISGAGKDTFQAYLKRKLEHRDVYDYSEGEVLNSWKQIQIQGISEVRVRFMKLFVDYVRDVISRDKNGVFLLNRFHLSAYVFTIVQQPQFKKDYDELINGLKTLPVHIFILQLDKDDIEKRSSHPERSGVWRKFQQEISKTEGFGGRLQRYEWQQRLMLELANRQQIPYSVINFNYEPEFGTEQLHTFETVSDRSLPMKTAKASRRKRRIPEAV